MAYRPFRMRRDGTILVSLYAEEVEALRQVVDDVATIVAAPPDGDIGARLYPRAYLDPTEEAAEDEFRSLVRDDLVRDRTAALAAIVTTLAPETTATGRGDRVEAVLGPEQADQWVAALNDARLVIGTALGVTEDDDLDPPPGDPRYELAALYNWLSVLQTLLVEVLLAGLGEAGFDDP